MDKHYISEFTAFMNRYLEEHPEAIKEQMRGWNFFWNPKIDPEESSNEDIALDDHYGFSSLFDAPGRKAEKHLKNPETVE